MVSAISPLLNSITRLRIHNASSSSSSSSTPPPPSRTTVANPSGRRQMLFLLTATTGLTIREQISSAQDIPLFGLRKKLKKAEEEAEEIVKEGIETAEKGIETAEKGIEAAERGIEAAEREVNFGGLAQAGVVVGAEAVGVLVATSVVNGILGSEP